jgi:sugar O-acyltransferase (sialic acid O-acetyltransferase NeuD family)
VTDLLLIGAGGHATSCADVIEHASQWRIIGMVGHPSEVGSAVMHYGVLGSDADLPRLLATTPDFLITVGQIKSPQLRMALFTLACSLGGRPATVVSPLAYVSRHATIGRGTIVMHRAVVNVGVRVGQNAIINSCALLEHQADVADHCHVSTHAAVNSGVRIGVGTFVGSGACVRQSVVIGEGCVIGMGERVLRDCAPGTWLPPRRRRDEREAEPQ